MPKKRSYPYRLGSPKTPNPMKEMSWCFSKHIYVSCQIEGKKVNGQWEMGNRYKLTIKQGSKYSETDYIYTKDDIMDAIYDTYIKLYEMNYGKETKKQ